MSTPCGTFSDPENPDSGACFPYRNQLDCERPALPPVQCDDDEYTVEASGLASPPFVVVSRIFDENCEPILDENNAPIMTRVA